MNARLFSLMLATLLLVTSGSSARAQSFTVDPVHSSVLFRIKHLNIAYVYGRFNEFSGTFLLDEANPDASSIKIEIKTASVDTNSADRDKHLKSPDFFNVKQFPTSSFQSKSVKALGQGKYEVTGELTLNGVTRPLTLTLTKTGEGDTPFKDRRAGFETNVTIKRSDFGIKFMPEMLEDSVWLLVSIEGARK